MNIFNVIPIPKNSITSNVTNAFGINTEDKYGYSPNGRYIITASSNNTDAYKAFDNNIDTSWRCIGSTNGYNNDPYAISIPSAYIGAENNYYRTKVLYNNLNDNNSTNDSIGEWIQIQTPFSFYLVNYTINIPRGDNFPIKYTILGSNNGTSWYYVDIVNFNKDSNNLPGKTKITSKINSIFKYSYYRLIINEIKPYTNNRIIKIANWEINGTTSHNRSLETTPLIENFNDLHLLSFENPGSFAVSSDKENNRSAFQMMKGLENTIYNNEFIDNFYILFFLILGIISTPVFFYYRNNKK